MCGHGSVEILMLRARGRLRFAYLFCRWGETRRLFGILLVQRSRCRARERTLGCTLPQCDCALPTLKQGIKYRWDFTWALQQLFPVFVPPVWPWSTVPGGKLSGGRSSCLLAGAAKLRTDFTLERQDTQVSSASTPPLIWPSAAARHGARGGAAGGPVGAFVNYSARASCLSCVTIRLAFGWRRGLCHSK